MKPRLLLSHKVLDWASSMTQTVQRPDMLDNLCNQSILPSQAYTLPTGAGSH